MPGLSGSPLATATGGPDDDKDLALGPRRLTRSRHRPGERLHPRQRAARADTITQP